MDNAFIFIKKGAIITRVPISTIYAVESEGNYCTIKTKNQEYVQRSSLTKMKDKLDEEGFIQVNKSTLLPIGNIDHINLTLNEISVTGYKYTLSRNFRKEFIERLHLL